MEFFQPQNLTEAVERSGLDTCFLAGGTDLVLQLREGKAKPQVLVDLSRVTELKYLTAAGGCLEIGSMLTFAELGGSELARAKANALWLACQSMGSPQIRNQATLGGNLANCSPAADGLPPLLALGALVRLVSRRGEETVPLAELLSRRPLLEVGTLIRGFRIPDQGWKSGFAKLGRRRALAIARLSVALAVEREGNQAKRVRVALGAVGERPFLSEALAEMLQGREMNEAWLEDAAAAAQQVVASALGSRASAPYKRVAVSGVMREAWASLAGGEGTACG